MHFGIKSYVATNEKCAHTNFRGRTGRKETPLSQYSEGDMTVMKPPLKHTSHGIHLQPCRYYFSCKDDACSLKTTEVKSRYVCSASCEDL